MSWLTRMKRGSKPAVVSPRAQRRATTDALVEWLGERRGVEIYVEPRTPVTPITMLLVAHDGEFTRKAIDSTAAARSFAKAHELPIYDATIMGYPQRMRDYSRRQSILERRERRHELGDEPGRS